MSEREINYTTDKSVIAVFGVVLLLVGVIDVFVGMFFLILAIFLQSNLFADFSTKLIAISSIIAILVMMLQVNTSEWTEWNETPLQIWIENRTHAVDIKSEVNRE